MSSKNRIFSVLIAILVISPPAVSSAETWRLSSQGKIARDNESIVKSALDTLAKIVPGDSPLNYLIHYRDSIVVMPDFSRLASPAAGSVLHIVLAPVDNVPARGKSIVKFDVEEADPTEEAPFFAATSALVLDNNGIEMPIHSITPYSCALWSEKGSANLLTISCVADDNESGGNAILRRELEILLPMAGSMSTVVPSNCIREETPVLSVQIEGKISVCGYIRRIDPTNEED